MLVKQIRLYSAKFRLATPYALGSGVTVGAIEPVYAQIETNAGNRGLGEATALAEYTSETRDSIIAALIKTAPKIRGKEFASLEEIDGALRHALPKDDFARSALECALADAFARDSRMDFAELFAGKKRKRLKLVGNIGIHSTEETIARARSFAAQGFETLKIKVGRDAKADAEKIVAVARALPRAKLRADANQGYSFPQAKRFLQALADEDVEIAFLEQPLAANDLRGSARLRSLRLAPIMIDEGLYGTRNLREILAAGANPARRGPCPRGCPYAPWLCPSPRPRVSSTP